MKTSREFTREDVDEAVFRYMVALYGENIASDLDYSAVNEALDDLETEGEEKAA